jgi:metal-responsive CopG/Arc/MetJ family transcriptional regulator
MKVVQIALDEELLADIDRAVELLGTSRSAFISVAVQQALRRLGIRRREKRHEAGYARYRLTLDEFDGWEAEQAWGDP